ncbi:CHY zinc finger protein [Evansella halocellulosilytica]|uniref:CHY zinc finger protein n=1 Tax=Evansella halocellulosilytica TaxID=2011013 RepID=UPI000BB9ADC5|nr:CHY zinc finger protein [Evansella halocellulosilytica]
MNIHGVHVVGKKVDNETRCEHYKSEIDRIAIKFKCCHTYYPCYTCHEELADHPPERWKQDEFNEKAILCGACGTEITINEYMQAQSVCPHCQAAFNPKCASHFHLYFDVNMACDKY